MEDGKEEGGGWPAPLEFGALNDCALCTICCFSLRVWVGGWVCEITDKHEAGDQLVNAKDQENVPGGSIR